MSFARATALMSRKLRDASLCGTCGKSTIVLQVWRGRAYRAEDVTATTHCDCPGGPASVRGKTDADFLRGGTAK